MREIYNRSIYLNDVLYE